MVDEVLAANRPAGSESGPPDVATREGAHDVISLRRLSQMSTAGRKDVELRQVSTTGESRRESRNSRNSRNDECCCSYCTKPCVQYCPTCVLS